MIGEMEKEDWKELGCSGVKASKIVAALVQDATADPDDGEHAEWKEHDNANSSDANVRNTC